MAVCWAREARECLPSFYYMWQASVALFVGCIWQAVRACAVALN